MNDTNLHYEDNVYNNNHDKRTQEQQLSIPSLFDLVHTTNPSPPCLPGKSQKRLIPPILGDYFQTQAAGNKNSIIPKIVHVTTKTRCMTPHFIRNIEQWTLNGTHVVFVHDDAAVDRLLHRTTTSFPHLSLIAKRCLPPSVGAATADLWRYVVLWTFGGIYVDIDAAPGPKLPLASFLSSPNYATNNDPQHHQQKDKNDEDQAWFVIERQGILSQYFMVAKPHHSLMYTLVMECLSRLSHVVNIHKQNVPVVTGPGVVKDGFQQWLHNSYHYASENKNATTSGVIKEGVYSFGMLKTEKRTRKSAIAQIESGVTTVGDTVTVCGKKGHAGDYVVREAISGIHKKGGYAAMGMTHFAQQPRQKDKRPPQSCMEALLEHEHQTQFQTDPL